MGKTMVAIAKSMALSVQYPNNLGLIVRKNFTDLRDSTMSDFTKYTGIRVPAASKDVELSNGSKILFRHLDELAGVTQNLNLGWFYIEQMEEFDSDKEFELLGGRLRREGCFRQGFGIGNTNGHNWIWRKWKNKGGTEYMCDKAFNPPTGLEGVDYSGYAQLVEATTFDNLDHLPADFIAALEVKKETAPSNYRRFVLNSWEDTDTADRVIPYELLLPAVNRDLVHKEGSVVVSCDPAEYGDDKSVIYVLRGHTMIDSKITSKKSLMETAGNIVAMAREHSADSIIIDDIGVGAGVRARIRELIKTEVGVFGKEPQLVAFNSGRSPRDKVRYVRLRDEVWMHAAQLFKDERVSLLKDEELIEDLAAFTYSMNSKGQMMIARKKDIKELLGRSPDRADALIMALWAADKAPARDFAYAGYGNKEEEYNALTYGLN